MLRRAENKVSVDARRGGVMGWLKIRETILGRAEPKLLSQPGICHEEKKQSKR